MNPRPNVDDAPVGTGITPRRAAVDDGVVAPVRGEASALSGTPTAAEAPIAARHAEQPASAPTPAQGKSTAEIGPPPAAVFEPAERRTRNGRPVWRPER